MNTSALKAWPRDVFPIIVAPKKFFRHESIRGVAMPCKCRDCGQATLADSFTIDHAIRCNRPLAFICTDCMHVYDINDVQYFEDHRGGETRIYRTETETAT